VKIAIETVLNLMPQSAHIFASVNATNDRMVGSPYVANPVNHAGFSSHAGKTIRRVYERTIRPVPYDSDAAVWGGRATGQQQEQGIAHGGSIYHA